jgi:hypothetical protein
MPYQLLKKKNKAFVENTKTHKLFSKSAIPLSNAEKQLKLLRMIEHRRYGGEIYRIYPTTFPPPYRNNPTF